MQYERPAIDARDVVHGPPCRREAAGDGADRPADAVTICWRAGWPSIQVSRSRSTVG